MRCWYILLGMLAAARAFALEPGVWAGVGGVGPPVFSTGAQEWVVSEVPEANGAAPSLHDLAWGLDRFLAVGAAGANPVILSSPTARAWRRLSLPSLAHPSPACVVAFGAHRFLVATARDLLISTDGETFIPGASFPGTGSLTPRAMACGDTEAGFCFVLIGECEGGGDVTPWRASTTDGSTIEHFDESPRAARAIAYGAGHFVAVGAGFIESSHDGQIWTLHAAPGDNLQSVVWTGRRFLATTVEALWTSPDALTWERRPRPTSPHLLWARDDPSPLVLAVSISRQLLISHDLESWAPISLKSPPAVIAFGPVGEPPP